MNPNESWYQLIASGQRLSQGDIVSRCPLLKWPKEIGDSVSDDPAVLRQLATAFHNDVIVMTQACDLEHSKVSNVVLSPHYSLSTYRQFWENRMKAGGQNPSEKAWRRLCDDIAEGYIWNQAMIDGWEFGDFESSARIVDFHEIFTLPRAFLEALLQSRNEPRVRLNPPYREHLSQSFARYFMRVGLPTPIERRP